MYKGPEEWEGHGKAEKERKGVRKEPGMARILGPWGQHRAVNPLTHISTATLAAPGIEMGRVSCGLRGLHSGLAWGILEGRAEINSWEGVKMLGSGL